MIKEIERYAYENNIPIIEKEGSNFLCDCIKKNDYSSILEIGSAIGYSAIVMALISDNIKITTIERDYNRYSLALKNIKEMGLEEQIIIYNDDALSFDESKLINKYDLIFIDAAKAQYRNFFEKYEKHLARNGVILIDNINFHGFVDGDKMTTNRNTRQLVNKIRKFNEWITNNDKYIVKRHNIGDGIFEIKRKV